MRFTVMGGSGFIGSHLAAKLRAGGHEVLSPARRELPCQGTPLGHVMYCVGLTADFRSRPFDTVRAHVGLLGEVLERCDFDSLLYLSSTRVYARSAAAVEDMQIKADVSDPGDLYNISKMLGESLCLAAGRTPQVRVARLSNVYGADFGSDNFLSTLLADAVDKGSVTLRTSADSAKDYIAIDDVVDLLERIAREGRHRLYNVASGRNVSNAEILAQLEASTGCRVSFDPNAAQVRFPPIDITRIREEFDFKPASLIGDLPHLIQQYREYKTCSESISNKAGSPKTRRTAK